MIPPPSIEMPWTALDEASAIPCTVIAIRWHEETLAMIHLLKRLEGQRDTNERTVHVQRLVDDNLHILPKVDGHREQICTRGSTLFGHHDSRNIP